MDTWPEFVKETVEDGQSCLSERKQVGSPAVRLTGWETVVFEVMDAQDEGGSDFSPAAIAP